MVRLLTYNILIKKEVEVAIPGQANPQGSTFKDKVLSKRHINNILRNISVLPSLDFLHVLPILLTMFILPQEYALAKISKLCFSDEGKFVL